MGEKWKKYLSEPRKKAPRVEARTLPRRLLGSVGVHSLA
ncbi:unannotated protein [freshwater metagenome]|uniref:Unannotated protein n=1 Tax=freshwater metagenome TaxID=449393 RepID=A0A6J7DS24_9ZZZZ